MTLRNQVRKRGCFIIVGLIAFVAAMLAWLFLRPMMLVKPPPANPAESGGPTVD